VKLRASKGSAYENRGKFFIRVTVAPQKRQAELAPRATTLEAAEARAKVVQGYVNRLRQAREVDFIKTVVELGAKADEATLAALADKIDAIAGGNFDRVEGGPLTFRTFAEQWTDGKLARRYPDHIGKKSSVQDDVERLEKHVYPRVEDVPLAKFTRADADRVMTSLPPLLGRATRRHVAQVVHRVLRLAVFTGAIEHSPLPPGWLPKTPKADSIAKESLLPSEEAKLLRGVDADGKVAVPLEYRALYLFTHREGMRKGEVRRLTWGDLDLERGMVALDENKTDRPRSWVLNPGVARVLARWKAHGGRPKATASVFAGIQWETLASIYRSHCKAVGIDRARLFEKKINKLRLRAHDMRAFFITFGMFAGRDALWITDRSGHTTLGMLRTYERDVRRWRELGEAPVDADLAVPELSAAAFTAAKHGSNRATKGARNKLTSRPYIANAEVAEWQTQRTQNPPSERV
jgi:integrase